MNFLYAGIHVLLHLSKFDGEVIEYRALERELLYILNTYFAVAFRDMNIGQLLMNTLQDYHWPGNIRELENVLERAVINSSGPKLHLVDELKKQHKDLTTAKKTLNEIERDYIFRVLEQTHWRVSGQNGAADILGLDRSTLRARMRKLGIQQP